MRWLLSVLVASATALDEAFQNIIDDNLHSWRGSTVKLDYARQAPRRPPRRAAAVSPAYADEGGAAEAPEAPPPPRPLKAQVSRGGSCEPRLMLAHALAYCGAASPGWGGG